MAGASAFHVLFTGYARDRVAGTVSLVLDGPALLVIDPGMVPDDEAILGPLRELGFGPDQITDVVLSHHHPDHTLRAGLFPNAAVHDHWATYRGDTWEDQPADGRRLSNGVRLLATPGHTAQDVTTLVDTSDGVIACTHLWWAADGPAEDPLATDLGTLHAGRARVLEVAALIVPGHGAPFVPGPTTPR